MSELQKVTEELVAELIKHRTLLAEVLNNASLQQLVAEVRNDLSADDAFKSGGEVDKTSTTYVEYPVGYNAGLDFDALTSTTYAEYLWRERTEDAQPSMQSNVVQGCSHLYAGLAPDVGQSNYSLEVLEFAYCPKCGEKL